MWELGLDVYQSTALLKYLQVTSAARNLGYTANVMRLEPHMRAYENESLFEKLIYIEQELASRELTFELLKNIPNVTFHQLIEELSPTIEDTVKYCTYSHNKCGKITKIHLPNFPNCFHYITPERNGANKVADEGITSGLNMVLMSGNHLAALILKLYQGPSGGDLARVGEKYIHLLPAFQNTFLPSSSEGFRVRINIPGVTPDVAKRGIDISPGFSTLIAITGKDMLSVLLIYQ